MERHSQAHIQHVSDEQRAGGIVSVGSKGTPLDLWLVSDTRHTYTNQPGTGVSADWVITWFILGSSDYSSVSLRLFIHQFMLNSWQQGNWSGKQVLQINSNRITDVCEHEQLQKHSPVQDSVIRPWTAGCLATQRLVQWPWPVSMTFCEMHFHVDDGNGLFMFPHTESSRSSAQKSTGYNKTF